MDCDGFEIVAHEQLNLRSNVLPAEWTMHINDCPACHATWMNLLRLTTAAAAWRQQTLTTEISKAVLVHMVDVAGLSERLSATDLSTRSLDRRTVSTSPKWGALLASALALMAMVGLSWQVSRSTLWVRQQHANSPVFVRTDAAIHTEQASNERQLDTLLSDAKAAYSELASQTWQHVSAASMLIPPVESATPFRHDDAIEGLPDSLTRPLQPIRDELRDVLNLLLDQAFHSQDSST